jgi:hypothetical protein
MKTCEHAKMFVCTEEQDRGCPSKQAVAGLVNSLFTLMTNSLIFQGIRRSLKSRISLFFHNNKNAFEIIIMNIVLWSSYIGLDTKR